LGLEKAGFKTKLAVEINKWASKTLIKNRPNWNVVQEDIQKITQDGVKNYLKDILQDVPDSPCATYNDKKKRS
jgi:DNA (cytosine-5)-methyltransferase 1